MARKFNTLYVGKKRAAAKLRDESVQNFIDMLKGNKYKPISIDDELELVYRAKEGDQKAIDALVNHNLLFVVSVAKEYDIKDCTLTIGDLVSEGTIGIINAINTFDPTIGTKLITHAVFSIRGAITAAISQKNRVVRQKAHSPIAITMQSTSLDAPISSDDNTTLGDILCVSTDAESFIKESLVNDLIRVMTNLCKPIEISVICSLYGIAAKQLTRNEIAEKLDITTERVRQIYEAGIYKIRNNKQAKLLLAKYFG